MDCGFGIERSRSRESSHIVKHLGCPGHTVRAALLRSQISSEADRSLTGRRALPVNNRGSDPGQPAPLQRDYFSSITLPVSLNLLPGASSFQRRGIFQRWGVPHIWNKKLNPYGWTAAYRGISHAVACAVSKTNIQRSRKWKESKVTELEVADIIDSNQTSGGQTEPDFKCVM